MRGDYVFCDRYGKPFKNFYHSLLSAVTLVKLDDLCIHDLRRTFGSNCVMAGVSLPTVQLWMGHQDISTTIKHYNHLVILSKRTK